MISFHPVGFTHGPHPKALQNAFKSKTDSTEEVALMLDSRDGLEVDESAESIEWTGYVNSWQTKE